MGFSAITEAWNSAIYASKYGPAGAMIVFGGGHNDYFGSDVHAFDLESREWTRLTTGFISGNREDYGEGAVYPDAAYPDGSPVPPHTYDYVQYDDVVNQLLLAKGQTELGPHVKAIAIPHAFDLDELVWRHGPNHETAILNSGGFTTWDRKRRLLWVHSGDDGGGNAFTAFCPDDVDPNGTVGSWCPNFGSKLPGKANHSAMQIHPESDLIYFAIHALDEVGVIDSVAPEGPIISLSSSGSRPRIREYAALEYSPAVSALIYYSAFDGAALYAIRGEREMNWQPISARDSMDPVDDAARRSRHLVNAGHTFGRFRIAHFRAIDLAILVRHVDTPVYCLALPS